MAPKKNETVIVPVIPQAVPVVPPTVLGNGKYENIYEGQLTNTFTTVNSKKTKHREITDKNGEQGWLFDLNEIGGGEVVLSEPDKNTLSMTSSQLLDIIALRLTEVLPYGGSDEELTKHLDCKFRVEDYMHFRELTVKEDAVKQLKKDLKALFNASTVATITYHVGKGKERKKISEKLEVHYVDAIPKGQVGEYVHFRIALSFARYLVHSQVMPYPLGILSSSKNKNFYYIGKKLAAHYNMNKKKKNAESVSVESLLAYTPEIPTFAEEAERGRHYKQKCIEPLVRTLDEMVEKSLLQEWTIWHGKNKPLSDEELNSWTFSKDSGQDLFIHFKLKDYPENQNKIKSKDILLIENDENMQDSGV